jgi:hypothetical protein
MLKFICRNCGAVNLVDETTIGDDVEWLDCLEPKGFEWQLPAGKITTVTGQEIYVSATGEHLSKEQYKHKYNVDPEIAYRLMRERVSKYVCVKRQPEEVSPPARTKSSNSSGNPSKRQELARASSPIRTAAWADEEDWV